MCVHASICACVFKLSDVFIHSEGCARVSLYIYVCECESMCVCVGIHICVHIWRRV